MTNVVVWAKPSEGKIFAAADSLVTAGILGRPNQVLSVTDQAIKIMKLDVSTRTILKRGEPFGLGLRLGLCFAGAVLPAMMTHAAAAQILGNLQPSKPALPPMAKIADLICYLSERYIKAASSTYGSNPMPTCEFILFGDDVDQSMPLRGGPQVAYRVMPARSGAFQQIKSKVDLRAGHVAVIGVDHRLLEQEIRALQEATEPTRRGDEPRQALWDRMVAQKHNTVGGTVQFGVLAGNNFELYTSMLSDKGRVRRNWLGFDCRGEISDLLGMHVKIPAKPRSV